MIIFHYSARKSVSKGGSKKLEEQTWNMVTWWRFVRLSG